VNRRRRAITAWCLGLLLAGLAPVTVIAQRELEQEQGAGQELEQALLPLVGDRERGRLVFGPCRACHYLEPAMGHNNGPNLYRIFGNVAGKQAGFSYYSPTFKAAGFVWTPALMYAWLENPMAMYPGSSMMSPGVPDPQRRADIIAYIEWASTPETPTGSRQTGSRQTGSRQTGSAFNDN
jgi:cytochrome c